MVSSAPIIIDPQGIAEIRNYNIIGQNQSRVQRAIENLTRQKTIIMIAHRLKTVRNADQILVIDKGRIVQKGKHDELVAQDGIYKNFITGRQQAVSWKIG